jgi:hypothetical protein
MNAWNRDPCCQLFKNLKMLPFKSQYIFSLLLFFAIHRDLYESNSEIHNIYTRSISSLHISMVNLTAFQKDPLILQWKSLITYQLDQKYISWHKQI